MNSKDLQKLADLYQQVHEKKDDSYLETDMKKRQENNEKARKEMAKVKGQKNPHFEQYTVTNADKKGNTTAYQNYKKGVKGKDGKPLYKAADHMKEGVRDTDPEKGTAERKARLEKKRGMKLDDHPQYKKEEVEVVAEADTSDENRNSPAHKDRSNEGLSDRQIRMKKFAQKRAQMLVKKEEVEVVDEATYPSDFKKGSPVATKKTGRPVQHDQKMSGGRRKTVDEDVEQVDEVVTPALVGGTLGAVTGKKGKKVQSAIGAGSGAAVGAALGGPLGAVAGGLVGKKVAEDIINKASGKIFE